MGEEYYRKSEITGKEYNIFECVRILNVQQSAFYMKNNIFPVDIKISRSKDDTKDVLVFYFIKDETKEAYDAWCRQKEDILR